MPSVYGKSKRIKFGAKVTSLSDFYSNILSAIEKQINIGRPVVVFFDSIDSMNMFAQSQEGQKHKAITMTVSDKNDPKTINDRVSRATRSGNITLFTRTFGRGIDFILGEKKVKEIGGLHVIQTFLSSEQAEAVQIEGRTARQGREGSYELIVTTDDLKAVGLDETEVNGKNPQEIAELLNVARNKVFEKQYSMQVAAA